MVAYASDVPTTLNLLKLLRLSREKLEMQCGAWYMKKLSKTLKNSQKLGLPHQEHASHKRTNKR